MPENNYKVFVCCITYNQARYIKETMDGFCLQQTPFPFLCGIVDDASTDGEQRVIADYMNEHFDLCVEEDTDLYRKLVGRHKTNTNCSFLALLLKENLNNRKKLKYDIIDQWIRRAEYYAICEGDDYWIDPHKLRKQTEFLESNPDYTMCCTNVFNRFTDGSLKEADRNIKKDCDLSIEDIILAGGECIRPPSMMYPAKYFNETPYDRDEVAVGDVPRQVFMAHIGKVRKLSDITAVYRVASIGSWTKGQLEIAQDAEKSMKNVESWLRLLNIMDEFTEHKYSNLFDKKRNRILFTHYTFHSRWKALKYFFKMSKEDINRHTFNALIFAFSPKFLQRLYLKHKG